MRKLPDNIKEWILRLSESETHLHMEGAVPFEMVKRALPKKFSSEPDFWSPDYRFDTFDDFSNLFAEVALAYTVIS